MRCQVNAIHGSGITVSGRNAKAHIAHCQVANTYLAGVAVREGAACTILDSEIYGSQVCVDDRPQVGFSHFLWSPRVHL
jgi:hypothetical protein